MKFIPDYIPANYKSRAEVHIFEALHKSPGFEDWICLHSLSLSHHMTKRESEVDFLFISPAGVFVVEVKGGRVTRHGGRWHFIDHNNHSHKGQSPFEQAKTSLYSIKRQIIKILGSPHTSRNLVFGYGVAFPDIKFEIESAEWDQDIVCDHRDLSSSLANYLNRLVHYWQTVSKSRAKLDQQQIKHILKYLRGDFAITQRLEDYLTESEQQIIHMTDEQLTALDMVSSNPRISLSGGAGTGKTMLAIKMFKYYSSQGQRVLFMCYNKLLGQFLKASLQDYCHNGSRVDSLHNFMRNTAKIDDQLIENADDKHDLFINEFPRQFLKNIASQDFQKYDYLIIDEGQDILFSQYLEVLDSLINRGLDNGRWLICMDENQNIYSGDIVDTWQSIKQKSAFFQLNANCRNTQNIIEETELVTGIKVAASKPVIGQSVRYIWYSNQADKFRQLHHTIESLLKQGVQPNDITILSPFKNSLAEFMQTANLSCPIQMLDLDNVTHEVDQTITCATISAHKGLENKVIILTDISDLSSQKYKMLYYVGFTRARTLLFAMIHKSQKIFYNELQLNSKK